MLSKAEKIASFDPDAVGQNNGNLFGLPFSYEDSELVILPVPWDVTVSYSDGTADGPQAILNASPQLDFDDPDFRDAWKIGFHLLPIDKKRIEKNKLLRKKADAYIRFLENGGDLTNDQNMQAILDEINSECAQLKQEIKSELLTHIKKGKQVALLGGDHSTPLGMLEAIAETHGDFAILQIDAHADLRNAYEGFTYSHASIMFNALKIPQVKKIVQVGIRDYCKSESDLVASSNGRIKVFYDKDIKTEHYEGKLWSDICTSIISELPEKIYISFDIDGLDPKLCPNTGTPVPGGFEFEQVVYLFRKMCEANKKIIAFDLNEVSPGEDEWDANVGARLLWKLCVFLTKSNSVK